MGCTSSAPNMTPSNTASENNLKLSEEPNKNVTESPGVGMIELKDAHAKEDEIIIETVLPVCDTVSVTIDEPVARNNTSIIEAPSVMLQEAVPENNENEQIHSELSNSATVSDTVKPPQMSPSPETIDAIQVDEKLSSLKKVVEKVIENHAIEKLDKVDDSQKEAQTEGTHSESRIPEAISHTEEAECLPSGSGSASSRATRWEAMADAAAELPPSLTVDPLTGQIYKLYR